jgi:ankyrin repeat protein
MVKKSISSKLNLLVSLLLAMLSVQCRCGVDKFTNQKETIPPPAITPITDEMLQRARAGKSGISVDKETIPPPAITPITDEMIQRARDGKAGISIDWEFLAKKLEALKEQNEVDINQQNDSNLALSALHYAALLGASDIVQALLDRDGNPNTETKDKDELARDKVTPLHLAAQFSNDTMVKSLLDKGAKVNAKNGVNKTPLDIALDQDPLPEGIIRLLVSKLSKDEINEKGDHGNGFLNRAFNRADYEETKTLANILLSHPGIDVNMPDINNNDNSPLHLAVALGYIDIVKILLGKHAKVNEKNGAGRTPLDIAFAQNPLSVEVIQLLVSELSKDQINEKGNHGNMFLHRAVNGSVHEASKILATILLKHPDIDVNVLDNNNNTPLHLAVKWRYVDIVKILLDKHAKLDMKNDSGKTPLELAEGKKFQEIIKLLKDHASKNP